MNIRFDVYKLKKHIEELYVKHKYIYVILFGSFATGHAKSYSDLDLAVMFEDEIDCLNKALKLGCSISKHK